MSPANMQAVGPFAPSVLKVGNKIIDKCELANRAIYKLVEEDEQLREAMEGLRFLPDGKDRWLKLRSRLNEVEKELKQLHDMAAAEKKKREAEKAAAEQKKRAAEKAAEEKRRAAEKAAAEEKHKQQILKQKHDQIKALKAQLATEQKLKAEAEAAVKKFKEEWAASEEKKRQALIKKADEELKFLEAELTERKRHADLLASYERERAVEEARKELEDAKRRLKLEYDVWRKKSYEAWKALERERKREVEEAERRAARKEKEVSDARKEAERRASLVQKSKEVTFDSSHNRTYDLSPAPHNYRQPEQQNVKHPDSDIQQKSHYPSHGHSRSQNLPHVSDSKTPPHPQTAPYRQVSQPKQHSSTQTYSVPHQKYDHSTKLGTSRHDHRAPVGLSGMPVESSIASYSPAIAPWEEKSQSVNDYAAFHEPQWQSHHDVSYQKASATEKKWSTPQIPPWSGPALDSNATDKKWLASPAPARPESPVKEKWSLPPSPPPRLNERKAWNVPSTPIQETEEDKLRREVEEYKKKCAKLAADLERKGRVTGADSVATWQTGMKSVWEDPTKDASKKAHQGDQTPNPQTAKPSSNKRNEQETKRDSKGTGSSKEPSKPIVSVQNLHRREPSVNNHNPSKTSTKAHRPEPNVHRKNERPESRGSTRTRYFEAEEHISSDEEHTPKPKFSQSNTHYGWRKPSLESIPRYVPPTPHRHQSPPPKLPPTPPRGSRVSTPATLRPAPKYKGDARQEIQTPKLSGIPGSWRDELPGKDSREDRWPANVSTPSVKSPPIAVKAKDKFKAERYIPSYYAPKDVPPPGSYLSTDTRHQQPGYGHPVPPYYGNHAAIPQPGPAYPIHHPLYAPQVQALTPSVDVEAGLWRHGGSFLSWADPTAAQSLGGTQAPPRKDKGKG